MKEGQPTSIESITPLAIDLQEERSRFIPDFGGVSDNAKSYHVTGTGSNFFNRDTDFEPYD